MSELMSRKIPGRSQDRFDAASCRVSVERIRDLWKIQSNRLAAGYLFAENDEDRDENLMGLILCCERAAAGLFLGNPDPTTKFADDQASMRQGAQAKRQERLFFIWESVLEILAPHEGKSRRQILLLALQDKFRYIPRAVRCDMLNQITSQRRKRIRLMDAGHDVYSDGSLETAPLNADRNPVCVIPYGLDPDHPDDRQARTRKRGQPRDDIRDDAANSDNPHDAPSSDEDF